MSREIEFRAWDKNHKNLHRVGVVNSGMIYFTLDKYADDQDYEYGDSLINLKTMPIMQYTGLKDKHGKKIFEGDVVKVFGHTKEDQFIDSVSFRNGSFVFINHYEVRGFKEYMLEVIGDIYSNPDLLEQAK